MFTFYSSFLLLIFFVTSDCPHISQNMRPQARYTVIETNRTWFCSVNRKIPELYMNMLNFYDELLVILCDSLICFSHYSLVSL